MPRKCRAQPWIPTFGILALLIALLAPAAAAAAAGAGLGALQADLAHQMALAGPADGAYVYDITAKKPLFSERASVTRPPASVEKLYTSAAVLDRMGPEARLTTSVYGAGQLLPGGTWEGSLYLRGGGDPTFGSRDFILSHYGGLGASINALTVQLVRQAGIHHITGSVYGDEGFFDTRRGEPSSGYGFDPFLEGVLSGLAFNRGEMLGHGAHAPAAFAAHALWGALKADGVSIRGASGTASTPAGAIPLTSVPSPTVAQLLGLMLPPSDNFFAETLVKDLGALYGGGGTTARGAAVVTSAISSTMGFTPSVVDGSGLSRADHTSPLQVVTLLSRLAGTPAGQVLREHLAVAGRSGTLEKRMRGTAAQSHCQGKTGTLTGASNLVGYCQAAGGQEIAFAIFNDGISTEAAHVFQDHIAISIARSQITSAELARASSGRP
ncbi:MAG TPA: D-alanyl-D-alanine carboxypeptidase/D-alanyl-D-alanine-endopeptidase [Solirubrobacteraceae bacterium]|nr:D-alanyl-D-alanine carboxypeptidase/D-alanyl-D-alanine-endopeptidase [Solirubrobacteraceae bacterium]